MPEIDEEILRIDYDSHWKEIIGEFFEDFTAFFMPDLHKAVDFTRPVEFLEQELLDIFKTKYKGKRINDKLVKVYLKDGTEKWVFIHIEVQATFEKDFAERMFSYYTLIYNKYELKNITAIAIFTNSKVPKNHNHFTHSLFGTTISYKFNSYKIRDQKEVELLKSNNPFALAVLANLYVVKTNRKYDKRLIQKERLFELAKKAGYDEKKLIRLLIFVRNLMVLPEDLEFQFSSHINNTLQIENIMLLNEGDIRLLEAISVAICGKTPEEWRNAEVKKILETEVKKAVEAAEIEAKKAVEAAEIEAKKAVEAAEIEAKKAVEIEAENKLKRSIIRYYEKNQFEGLAQFCEALEINYLFAEGIITEHLNEKKEG